MNRAFAVLLATAAALFATGIWWGVPDHHTWAPDEIIPTEVLAGARQRFAGGWTSIYPPLHYLLLAALYVPIQKTVDTGLVPLDTVGTLGAMMIAGRLLTLSMALGALAFTYRSAREAFDSRAGLVAATLVAVTLPVTYYAKTVNLDIPYTFWVLASLVCYARTFRSAEARDFYGFALLGSLAICTKDQAYAFFVLPAGYIILGSIVHPRAAGIPARRVLAGMATVTLLTLIIGFAIPLNPTGFVEHIRLITGEPSGNYRMFAPDLPGQFALLLATCSQVGSAMSWPLAIAAAGAAMATCAANWRAALPFVLPLVSYYASFLAVVGYVYDRFLIGPVALLSILAAPALMRWMMSPWAGRWLTTILAVFVLFALSRAAALDYLMVRDSRYAVEEWLVTRRGDARVAAVGRAEQLPRQSRVPWRALGPDLEELAALDPDIVVVNSGFARRAEPETEASAFYRALRSGAAGYRLAETFRTSRDGLPLALEDRFVRIAEDPYSNLVKVNPAIEVYVRADGIR